MGIIKASCQECSVEFEYMYRGLEQKYCSEGCRIKRNQREVPLQHKIRYATDLKYHKKINNACRLQQRKYVSKRHKGTFIYRDIVQRCSNPNNPYYHRYGGRGIRCEINMEQLIELYDETIVCGLCGKLLDSRAIDRIDNNGNYKLGNIRFVHRGCHSGRHNLER